MSPESFATRKLPLGGDHSAGEPGTAMVGVAASIQLYDASSLTSVIDAPGEAGSSSRSDRVISTTVEGAILGGGGVV